MTDHNAVCGANNTSSYSHCPTCGLPLVGGQFACGHIQEPIRTGFMRPVQGSTRCIRCDWQVTPGQTTERDNEELHQHLDSAHPDWQGLPAESAPEKICEHVSEGVECTICHPPAEPSLDEVIAAVKAKWKTAKCNAVKMQGEHGLLTGETRYIITTQHPRDLSGLMDTAEAAWRDALRKMEAAEVVAKKAWEASEMTLRAKLEAPEAEVARLREAIEKAIARIGRYEDIEAVRLLRSALASPAQKEETR